MASLNGKIQDQNPSFLSAMNQQVVLKWKNLSVYVAEQTQNKNEQIKTNKVALVEEKQLITRRSDSIAQYQNERALALNNGKIKYKCILNDQNGYALPGELTAIMGPSGAGKTTFIAALTQRLVASKSTIIDGAFLANGENFNSKKFSSFGAFIMQNDLLMSTMTQECLLFSACLRLGVSEQEKRERVDKLIQDLQLQNCQHTYVGDAIIKGISGGERKRTSIGVELISDPNVIVLDEPTSGLDSFTAFILIDILEKIAKKQMRTILFTIHQPSADIFQKFDKLILLSYGRTAYQGQANQLVNYMRQIGNEIPKFCNPCDFFMNKLRDPDSKLTPEQFLSSENYSETESATTTNQQIGILQRKVLNSFYYEFNKLTKRQLDQYVRNPTMLKGRIFGTIFFTIFMSVLFYRVFEKGAPSLDKPNTSDAVQQFASGITGCLFFLGTGMLFSAMGSLLQAFPVERQIFLKEVNSQTYRVLSYFLAKMIIEIPIAIISSIIQYSIAYYFMRFSYQGLRFLYFIIICVLVSLNGNGIGLFAGSLIPDPKRAAAMAPLILVPLQLFSGLQSNLAVMSPWISWFQYISPFKYFFEGLVRTQFDGIEYPVIAIGPNGQYIITQYNIIEVYGLSFGLNNCIIFLTVTALGFHFLSYILLQLKVTQLSV